MALVLCVLKIHVFKIYAKSALIEEFCIVFTVQYTVLLVYSILLVFMVFSIIPVLRSFD